MIGFIISGKGNPVNRKSPFFYFPFSPDCGTISPKKNEPEGIL